MVANDDESPYGVPSHKNRTAHWRCDAKQGDDGSSSSTIAHTLSYSYRLARSLDVDKRGGIVVRLIYHPYLFGGRVETALRGGLRLRKAVTIDQQRQNSGLQSLRPRPQGHAAKTREYHPR